MKAEGDVFQQGVETFLFRRRAIPVEAPPQPAPPGVDAPAGGDASSGGGNEPVREPTRTAAPLLHPRRPGRSARARGKPPGKPAMGDRFHRKDKRRRSRAAKRARRPGASAAAGRWTPAKHARRPGARNAGKAPPLPPPPKRRTTSSAAHCGTLMTPLLPAACLRANRPARPKRSPAPASGRLRRCTGS